MSCSGNVFRSSLLGLALLLAVLANFVSFSYDADEQDSVPPVRVELKFVVRSSLRAHAFQSTLTATSHHDAGTARSQMPAIVALHDAEFMLEMPVTSPQRLLPLLC
jgi:hypothetical protein